MSSTTNICSIIYFCLQNLVWKILVINLYIIFRNLYTHYVLFFNYMYILFSKIIYCIFIFTLTSMKIIQFPNFGDKCNKNYTKMGIRNTERESKFVYRLYISTKPVSSFFNGKSSMCLAPPSWKSSRDASKGGIKGIWQSGFAFLHSFLFPHFAQRFVPFPMDCRLGRNNRKRDARAAKISSDCLVLSCVGGLLTKQGKVG